MKVAIYYDALRDTIALVYVDESGRLMIQQRIDPMPYSEVNRLNVEAKVLAERQYELIGYTDV